MKYQSSNTKHVFDIEFGSSKGNMHSCPECSPGRKKSSSKDLKYYPDTERAYCHHCNTTFFEYKPYEQEKQYVVPEWKNKTNLTDKAVKYFEGRMIKQDTLIECKVYSDTEWMPQFQKEVQVMCFPFFKGEKLINVKYRGAKKSFKLVSGAELIWWNFNAIQDNKELIICEGEIDGLTVIENGFNTVGIDGMSVDDPLQMIVHKQLLGNGINIVECLDLCGINEGMYGFMCLPLKIIGCDGAPARAVLFEV